jgi:HEAT repeat protein
MPRGRLPSLLLAAATLLVPVASASADQTWGFDWLGRIEHDAKGLESDEDDVRLAAVNALRGYDPTLTKRFLLDALDDESTDVRIAAARALGAGAVQEAAPALIAWLADPDPRLRAIAAEALGPIGGKTGTGALVRTLGDVEPSVRSKAVLALGTIGQKGDRSVVVPLLSRLGDDKIEVRRAAIEQLRAIGDRRAVVPLVAAFGDNSQEVRKAAVQAVGRLGDKAAVPALMRLLADPVVEVRGLAISALGELGAVEAVDDLVAIVTSGSDAAPRAAFALGQIARGGDAEAAPEAVRALVSALADATQRPGAIEGLRTAGTVAVAPLVAHLDGRLPGDPRSAVELLAELGDARATEALVAELERGRVAVATVVSALARTRDPRALVPVLRLVAADDPAIRLAAMTAVGPLLGSDPRASDAIVERLGDDDEEIRVLAAEYLGQIKARVAVTPLLALTGDAHPERLRRAAIDALGEIGDPAAVATLVTALRDGPVSLQQAAADALGAIADPRSAAQLARLADTLRGPGKHHAVRAWGAVLREHPDASARGRLEKLATTGGALEALAAIGALAALDDAGAVPALVAIAAEGTPERQRAALWALGELGDERAIAPLVAALASKDDRVSATAAWALGDLAREPALQPKLVSAAGAPLRRLMRRGSWATAIDATAAVGRIGVADATADLGQMIFHRSPLVRANAAWSLGTLAAGGTTIPPTVIESLARQVTEDTSAAARASAARALGRVKDRGTAATAALTLASESDRDERVRAEAKASLSVPSPTPARDEWRVFYVVDASSADRPVREEPYFVIGGDGLAWATYTDLRGHITAEHFPAGDAVIATSGSEPGI